MHPLLPCVLTVYIINPKPISSTHIKHSPPDLIYIKYYLKQLHNHQGNARTANHITLIGTHTYIIHIHAGMTVAKTGY